VQRRHHGLAAVFDGPDHGRQLRLGQRLAEFAQVRARDEGGAGADQDRAVQTLVAAHRLDGRQQASTHGG
jgi:hypothetical protein